MFRTTQIFSQQKRHNNRSQNISAVICACANFGTTDRCASNTWSYCNYARILLQFTVSERYGMCTARRECDIASPFRRLGDNSQKL